MQTHLPQNVIHTHRILYKMENVCMYKDAVYMTRDVDVMGYVSESKLVVKTTYPILD